MRVERPEQLREALERGFASDTIFVVDALCDYRFPDYNFVAATEELLQSTIR